MDTQEFQGITDDVNNGIGLFVTENIARWKQDAIDYALDNGDDEEGDCITLTFATNEKGSAWGFQSGDNSYTGGAYGFPHWAVVYVDKDTKADDLMTEIEARFNELV